MTRLSWRNILAGLKLRYLFWIVLLLAVIIFLVATNSIKRNRSALLEVMFQQGESLIQALVLAGENIVISRALLEKALSDQISDAASLIDLWNQSGALPSTKLAQVAKESGYLRIDFMDAQQKILKSSESPADLKIYSEINSELSGELKELSSAPDQKSLLRLAKSDDLPEGGLLWIEKSRYQPFFILILRPAGLSDQAEKEIGIGYLVQKMGQEPGIEYAAMQAPQGIVFASENIEELYKIETDPFLQEALDKKITRSRIAKFQGQEILEVVRPFQSAYYPEGIFRIGLSLDNYDRTVSAFTRQTVFISAALFLVGLLLVGIVIINRNYFALEEALQKTESLTLSVLESMESAVIAVDSSGRITTFNRVAETLFSKSREQILGESYARVFGDDPWLVEQFLQKKTKVKDFETRLHSLQAGERVVLVSNSGIFAQGGKLQGAISVIHDITELKKLEEESKRSERLSALGSLAAGVAHEVRNPLNAIAIAAQRLKSEFTPVKNQEDYQSFLHSVLSEIKRLDQIVNQFLSLARSQKLKLEPTDSTAYLNEILDLAKLEAEPKGISVVKRLEQAAVIQIDRAEMKKALLNIILNGIQAMDSGGTLTVETRRRENMFQVAVSDTGQGISESDLAKIFQPYFTTKEKGSGLGLAIAHRIVTDHRGKIEVQSQVGRGTTFVISLPLSV